MDTFPTPTPPRLSLDVKAGTVTVETADVVETTVEITALDDSDITLDALRATTVDQRGNVIAVHVPNRFGFLGRTPKLAIEITAPHDARLAVKTGSADVVAIGRFGTSQVQTGSGGDHPRRLHRLPAGLHRKWRRPRRVGRQGHRRQDGLGRHRRRRRRR